MKMLPMRFILTIAVFLVTVSCHHTVQADLPKLSNGAVIEAIRVVDNRAISTEAIVAKIQQRLETK